MGAQIGSHLTFYTLFTDTLFTSPRAFPGELCETISHYAQCISNFAQEVIRQIGELFFGMTNFFERQINGIVEPIANFFNGEPPKDPRIDPKNFLAFIRNEEPNNDGIRVFDILSQDDDQLNDFLLYKTRFDWFFPRDIPSNYSTVPVLDRTTIAALRSDHLTINRVYPVFLRFLRFFGLTIDHEKNITRGLNFNNRSHDWLNNDNPHRRYFLRMITDIIHSMGLMLGGDNEYGRALFRIMEDIYRNEGRGIIPEETYHAWQNAVRT